MKEFKSELSQTLTAITEQNQKALQLINTTLDSKVEAVTKKIDENNTANRESLATGLKDFILEQRNKFSELKEEQKELTNKTIEQLEKISGKVEEKLTALNEQAKNDNNAMRDALATAFKGFGETFNKNVESFNNILRFKVDKVSKAFLPSRENSSTYRSDTLLASMSFNNSAPFGLLAKAMDPLICSCRIKS